MFLKKLITKLIKNHESDIALESIYDIRTRTPDFYALELGYYFLSLKNYTQSLTEYLIHLEKHPKHFQMINSRVMSFPNDKKINSDLINLLNKSTINRTKINLLCLVENKDFIKKGISFKTSFKIFNLIIEYINLQNSQNNLITFIEL